MRHTMFLIQSLRRSKTTLSSLSQTSIIPNFHPISPPPFPAAAPPFQGGGAYAPFFTRSWDKNPKQDPIQPNSARALARSQDQALARSYSTRERLWNLLRWSSPVLVILAVFWYLEKNESTNGMNSDGKENVMKELRREKFGSMKKSNEFVASNPWEGLQTYEIAHYMLYLSMFYAFFASRTQVPKFGQSLVFWFTLISSVGLLFSRVSSNLANYAALTSRSPFFYQISGAWSNHEGSLLLFCLIFTFYLFIFRCSHGKYY